MKHGFTREQIKRIILEELNNSKVQDAAEDIADELENLLTESEQDSFLKKAYDFILRKSDKENLDPDELAIETYKQMRLRRRLTNLLGVITLSAFAAGVRDYKETYDLQKSYEISAEKTTDKAIKNIESQKATTAVKELSDKLEQSVLYAWSLDPEKGGEEAGEFITGTQQNFPLFLDYNAGRVEIFSPEYGVVLKLKNDIQKQIDSGITNKKDLKPMIDQVKEPSMSKEELAQIYKNLYDIPETDFDKVKEKDIGGNIERVAKKTKGGMRFMQARKGQAYAYEDYKLSNFVNAELPNNPGMSPSQFYMKLFNDITGQNIDI
jgi:hypothetical protein